MYGRLFAAERNRTVNKQKIGILMFAIAAALVTGTALGDDSAWKYDTSRRTEVVPSSSSVSIPEIDSRFREADISSASSIDKWYWTAASSNAIVVSSTPVGLTIIFK